MARRPFSLRLSWAFLLATVCGFLAASAHTATAQTTQPTFFVAKMTPVAGVTDSLGYGSATLRISADGTYATLKFSYANLTSPLATDHVRAPQSVDYDISVATPQADGSYKWTFKNGPILTPAQTLAEIQAGQATITLYTTKHQNGEISGPFIATSGSQTFTPPANPSPITINPPTTYDASRFLQQAGFGGTLEEINALANTKATNAKTALNDWLSGQFASQLPIAPTYSASTQPSTNTFSATSVYKPIYDRVTKPQAPNAYADAYGTDRIVECWWHNSLGGTDQLRQRVATALSELFVVSEIDSNINNNTAGLATYYDMLADDAFVNFYDPDVTKPCLLRDVTLHPVMGDYLNMRGNNYSTKSSPNENYAREVMQLFTIGLYMLQPDGTLQLDANGDPIPTYTQPTITSFAHVYTGWNQTATAYVIPTLPAPKAPATQPTVVNVNSFWQVPMVVNPTLHSPIAKQLLSYKGAKLWAGSATTQPTDPVVIPATAKPTAGTAATELEFALANIFNHPNVGPFVCKQLIQRLVTSNPSPAYVYRVAQMFNDDKTTAHVRGNMKAVVTAILTDYEARSPSILANPFAGHMREPLIRMANIMRPLHAFSNSGKWKIGSTNNTLSQTIFRSPTVFNFFPPDYAQPGAIQGAGEVSPELSIIFATTISNSQNMIYTGVYSPNYAVSPVTGTGWRGDNYGTDVYLPLTTTKTSTVFASTSAPASILTNVEDSNITTHGGVELGMKFTSEVGGVVSAVRFWKGTKNLGTHTGTVWSSTGQKLATATFAGETASGWQQVSLFPPLTIAANTTYIVSYHTTSTYIAYTPNVLSDAGIDVAPLHVPMSTATSGNDVYRYDSTPNTSSFPNVSNGQAPSYWVDVVFTPSTTGLVGVAEASGVSAMLDQVGLLLTSAPLDPNVKSTVQNYISSNLSATNYLGQVQAAIYLIGTSAQCAAEK